MTEPRLQAQRLICTDTTIAAAVAAAAEPAKAVPMAVDEEDDEFAGMD
jgi:hypothetical protein